MLLWRVSTAAMTRLSLELDRFLSGDAVNVLPSFPDLSINLIVTSPPYADQRQNTYGGTHPDHYVAWFLPIAKELYRVLKDDGSFVLNIKERVVNGERHTYVLELIMALRSQGWLWTEEYIWHKKTSAPGKWPNRFRDAWERCLHFTKRKNFAMYQDEVMVPVGDWAKTRMSRLSNNDQIRVTSKTDSGIGKNLSNWIGRNEVYPDNVLHLAPECSNRGHSAVFPQELPSWFIRVFTKPGDVVLDPFMGSGTTAIASRALGRHFMGIDNNPDYIALAEARLNGFIRS